MGLRGYNQGGKGYFLSEGLKENPFPFIFQLLETACVPELLVPVPSSEPAMQHLSDHVSIVTSLSHTQEKRSPLLRIRVI